MIRKIFAKKKDLPVTFMIFFRFNAERKYGAGHITSGKRDNKTCFFRPA